MSLRLGGAPEDYSQADQQRMRADLNAADRLNHKRGEDVEIGKGRLILTDRVTGARYQLVSDSGVLSLEAMP